MTVEKQLVDTVDRPSVFVRFFLGLDKRKTTKNDTAHAPDREGNEMFMLRRRGKTLTLGSKGRHWKEQEMNEIKNRFPSKWSPKIDNMMEDNLQISTSSHPHHLHPQIHPQKLEETFKISPGVVLVKSWFVGRRISSSSSLIRIWVRYEIACSLSPGKNFSNKRKAPRLVRGNKRGGMEGRSAKILLIHSPACSRRNYFAWP